MIVVDASAILDVLVGEPNPSLAARLADENVLHAPHLLDTEVLHVLRRLAQRASLSDEQAVSSRTLFSSLAIDRYPHAPLSDRVWELRTTLTAYDATYVALAETLEVPLVTTDRRIAGAVGIRTHVEVH